MVSCLDIIRLLINDTYYMAVLIIFLGNPGIKYKKTRHNYGKMVCSGLEKRFPALFWRKKFNSDFTEIPANFATIPANFATLPADGQSKILLLCPGQYMNNSGTGAAACAQFFSIPTEKIIVIHDDLETPFGSYVFQRGGGLAGHNGLRSISGALGSNDFYRLKMGIGRPDRGSVSSFVLGRFSPLEESQLPDCIESAVELLYRSFSSENLKNQPVGRFTVFTS